MPVLNGLVKKKHLSKALFSRPLLIKACSNNTPDMFPAQLNKLMLLCEATSKVNEKLFSLDQVGWLRNVCLALYPMLNITHVCMAPDVFNEVSIFGEKFLLVRELG